MLVKATHVVAGALLASTGIAAPAWAGEWGCEVLLCASSANPSWRGISACDPPMTQLLSAMEKPGFKWPTCPEAGTGSPGFERYGECPEGYRIGSSTDHNGSASKGDLCVRTVNICQGKGRGVHSSGGQGGCIQTVSISRPLRSEPYFFDIKNDTSGQTERHWFSLQK